jgi:hypothetical protein
MAEADPYPLESIPPSPEGQWVDTVTRAIDARAGWRWAAIFGVIWMAGSWLSDVHTGIPLIHAVGAPVALGGAILCLVSSYAAVQTRQLRRRHTKLP